MTPIILPESLRLPTVKSVFAPFPALNGNGTPSLHRKKPSSTSADLAMSVNGDSVFTGDDGGYSFADELDQIKTIGIGSDSVYSI